MADPACCTALLDRRGLVVRSGGWRALQPGTQAAAYLAEPAASLVRRALAAGNALAVPARLNGTPVALNFNPLPANLVRFGPVAAVLRLSDRTRERELEEALGQAQRLQEVGELAGGIAHDFNNLLTAILGAAEDLLAHASDTDAADLTQIQASALRGADLVRQLLAFSQRQTLQPRVLVLDDAVGQAANLLRRLLGSRVNLVLDLKAPGRQVRMDATQLDQVLMNLAVNARNAMSEGGTLTIATDWRMVLGADAPGPDALPPGRYATIDITDTGGGIAPELLPRIFDPFFTTRRGQGGTGLGLSMVQGIVRQSSGHLSVRSTPGAGTCFTITLPRYQPVSSDAPAAPNVRLGGAPVANLQRATQGRILLVDDDDAIRLLAKRALVRDGWDVVEADGAEAALKADIATLECVVSDVAMPGLDGPGLVRALRLRRPALPALLISGHADAGQRRALAAEDIAFLPKPFKMSDLTGAVRTALAPALP